MAASQGLVKLVSIAPEEPGAMEFIEAVEGEVTVSIAHTTADYDTSMEAFRLGARQVTHLFNAMPAFSHRAPAWWEPPWTPLCNVELICDGVHPPLGGAGRVQDVRLQAGHPNFRYHAGRRHA